jgi:ornithine cyclodeaminase/alanine dehydrogenase-like protein (mu-crystallin family)
VVETRDSAWSEAGELIISREEGLIDDSNVLGELTHPEKLDAVRTSERDITLFKSVGNAAADSAAVRVILNHLDSSSS